MKDMYEAVDYYLRLGFTPEVICNQIEFGCLNVDSAEIRRLYNIYKRRGNNGRRYKISWNSKRSRGLCI